MQSAPHTCPLPTATIIATEHIQPRERLNTALVEEYQAIYTEAAPESVPFPALDVFQIDGTYYVADGFHRLAAAQAAGIPSVVCQVYQGTEREAMLHAAGANAHHGLRYTAGDKERILRRVLADAEIWAHTDRAIARRFGMSHVYVGKVRKRISAEHQVSAELVTVTTTARSPQGKPRQRVAEILGVPSENLKATETTGGLSAERITQELVRRVAKGEDYKAVKEELARKVDSGAAARAAEQKARAGARGEKTRFYARRWREQQVAGALERVAQSTRRLDTRPEGVLGRDLLAVWREADRQQRDPEAMQRPYPGTFEERQALRSDPHHHKN